MKALMKFLAVAMVASAATIGCKDKPKQIAPAVLGERNESCLAANDCGEGLSCIGGRCSPTEFAVNASGKECIQWECDDTADCCGDKPTQAPPECNGRTEICGSSQVANCSSFDVCTADVDCGEGTCGQGSCSGSLTACTEDAQCPASTGSCNLITGLCQDGFTSCGGDIECPTVPGTCASRQCDCVNPLYDPTDPICTSPACDDLCTEVCLENNLCGADPSCETNLDCASSISPICTADGRCVECEANEDCDEDGGETCNALGMCNRPCEFNQECAAFHECNTDTGECFEVGCKTNKDCILDPSFGTSQDKRLAVCVTAADGIGDCRLPCEHSGHCSQLEVCSGGFCELIGCDNNEQCDRADSLQNQPVSEQRPYVTEGRCVVREAQ